MYSSYFMFCEPPRHQGSHQGGLTQKNSHQGDQVGTGGVVSPEINFQKKS